MTTNESTSKIEAAYDVTIEPLSDEKLDQVVGGINPQPLPPRDPDPQGLRAQ
jgi:bacteriocin-like protein